MSIKIYDSVQDMCGLGEEWLMDARGNIIAVFIDGNLRCEVYRITDFQDCDVTKAII